MIYGAEGFPWIDDQSWFSIKIKKTVLMAPTAGCVSVGIFVGEGEVVVLVNVAPFERIGAYTLDPADKVGDSAF